MNWLNKMERKFGKYAIKNLTIYLLVCYGIGYIISMVMPTLCLVFKENAVNNHAFLLNVKSCCSFQIQKADLCLESCLLRLYPTGTHPQLLAEKFRHEKKPQ